MDLATERMIGSGKQHADLYYMSPLPNQAHASQISTDPDLWYKRLRHPSLACLQHVSSLLPILLVKISFPFIIIIVFVSKLNRQGYPFL